MLRKLFYFFRFPILVFVLSLVLGFVGIYDSYPWIDIPMHLIGGAVIAYSFILILNYWQDKNLIRINNKLIYLIIIVALVSLIAVCWEFAEYIVDYFFNLGTQEGLWDTIFDLFLGVLGGFVVVVFRKYL